MPTTSARRRISRFRSPACSSRASASRCRRSRDENFFLRARDGYVKPASGARLAEPGGWLAFADAEHTQRRRAGLGADRPPAGRPGSVLSGLVGRGPERCASLSVALSTGGDRDRAVRSPLSAHASEGSAAGLAGVDGLRRLPGRVRRVSRDQRRRRHDRARAEPAAEHRRVSAGCAAEELHPRIPRSSATRACRRIRTSTPEQLDGLIAYFTAMRERKHDPRRALPAP